MFLSCNEFWGICILIDAWRKAEKFSAQPRKYKKRKKEYTKKERKKIFWLLNITLVFPKMHDKKCCLPVLLLFITWSCHCVILTVSTPWFSSAVNSGVNSIKSNAFSSSTKAKQCGKLYLFEEDIVWLLLNNKFEILEPHQSKKKRHQLLCKQHYHQHNGDSSHNC